MSVRRGEGWGAPTVYDGTPPPSSTDAEAADAIGRALASEAPAIVALAGGDLARTLGGGSPGRLVPGATVVRAVVDVMRVVADDGTVALAIAHVVARRWRGPLGWLVGPVLLVMNAEFVGRCDVAPPAHPGDGRLDVVSVEASMGVRQRLVARRRSRAGGHLPHPSITVESRRAARVDLGRRCHVWLDGRHWRQVRWLEVSVEPDAATVLV